MGGTSGPRILSQILRDRLFSKPSDEEKGIQDGGEALKVVNHNMRKVKDALINKLTTTHDEGRIEVFGHICEMIVRADLLDEPTNIRE